METTAADGSDVDNVTTFSINPDKEIHASAVGPLEDTSTFSLSEDGEAKKTLTVVRTDGQLTITQTDLPKTP